MSLNYNHIREFVVAGKTAAEIATEIQTSPLYNKDISVSDLANVIHHEFPVAFINPEPPSGHYGPLIEVRKNPGVYGITLVAGIDRLIHHIHQPTAHAVECSTDVNVAMLLTYIIARFQELKADPSITAYGLDVDALEARILQLNGGLKWADYRATTEADVQALIDAEAARVAAEEAAAAAKQALAAKKSLYTGTYRAKYNTHIAAYLDAATAEGDLTPAGLEAAIQAAATAVRTELGG